MNIAPEVYFDGIENILTDNLTVTSTPTQAWIISRGILVKYRDSLYSVRDNFWNMVSDMWVLTLVPIGGGETLHIQCAQTEELAVIDLTLGVDDSAV